ncbi:hypothetical protein O3M35_012696 [Rhynocoris fuscipes]|uniref:AB hydrolase-1 domain-containing protein n=1 Tax=Rhynocoris fuscipes TaxID=488301 RepID=A0AAW1CUV5_9HEMI
MSTTFKEIEIPVPWGTINGKWWGPQDKRPFLFLHGWQDNSGSFDALIPLLPHDLSILCVDFPGHGLSTHYNKGQFYYIFWDGLITARRVVKYFGWPKVSIVGHSLGGAVGFMYAATYPDEVEKLVSLDIVCPRVSKPSSLANGFGKCIDTFLRYELLTPDKQPNYEYEEMVDIALDGYKGSVTRDGVETLLKRGMKPIENKPGKFAFNRDVRLKVVSGLGMPSLDIVLEMADKLRCHYLNIRAVDGLCRTMESPEVYPIVLERLKKNCRSFRYHVIDGKHHLHLNEPEKISEIISTFLTAVEPQSGGDPIEPIAT